MASEMTRIKVSPRAFGVCALVPVPPGRAANPKMPDRRILEHLAG